jgi:micrococcal nuclease
LSKQPERERGWLVGVICLISAVALVGALLTQKLPSIQLPDVAAWVQDKTETTIPGFYRVVEVADGDTFVVDMNGRQERVRLIGVDTPETHHPERPVQCFGIESSNYLKSLLKDKAVRLESDPTNTNRDRYDRLLRYAYLEDNRLVNQLLVEQGYGFAYTRFAFIKKADFLASEERANAQKLGLWGKCNPSVEAGQYRTDPAQ